MSREEIARYIVIGFVLAFGTLAAGWSMFPAEEPVHHFDDPSDAGPFTVSFTFLFLVLVGLDLLAIRWLVRRIRGRG